MLPRSNSVGTLLPPSATGEITTLSSSIRSFHLKSVHPIIHIDIGSVWYYNIYIDIDHIIQFKVHFKSSVFSIIHIFITNYIIGGIL